MKCFPIVLVLCLLVACNNKLSTTKSELIGCWKLTMIDGKKDSKLIHYVKYDESEGNAYWGSESDNKLFISSSEFDYELKLDENKNVLLTILTESDTTLSEISIANNSVLTCKVLKSNRIWKYERISQRQLDQILSSAIDPKQLYK